MHWTAQVGLICLISNFHLHLYLDDMVIGYWLSGQYGYWSRKELRMIGRPSSILLQTEWQMQKRIKEDGKDKSEMKRGWDRFLRVFNTTLIFIFSNTWHKTGMGGFGSHRAIYQTAFHTLHWWELWEVGDIYVYVTYMWPIKSISFFGWRRHKQLTWNNQGIFQTRLNITLHIETILEGVSQSACL